jgi:dihydroorotate dehydrogenase
VDEAGGLSGAPVKHASTRVVKALAEALNGKLPIIAAGGILSAADAEEKRQAGAQLVQIYSGLIYQGPQLITDMLSEFKAA